MGLGYSISKKKELLRIVSQELLYFFDIYRLGQNVGGMCDNYDMFGENQIKLIQEWEKFKKDNCSVIHYAQTYKGRLLKVAHLDGQASFFSKLAAEFCPNIAMWAENI